MAVVLPFRLIPTAAAQAAQAAFLPGSDVSAWLEEMARHPQGRFYPVPAAADDVAAGGLLVMPGPGSSAFGPRMLPCIIEHGCVIVPATTRLDPQLTADEARRLLTFGVYFFHPTIGLIAFEETDAVTPQSLIVPPLLRRTSWLCAVAGPSSPPALRSVRLALPEDPNALFGSAPEGIASLDPRDLQRKAPLKERLRDALLGGAAGVAGGLIKGLGGLAGMLGGKGAGQRPPPIPGSANSPGHGSSPSRGIPFMDRLRQWSAKQWEKLERQRESEIQRLLKLLESDPEKGLRYALPLESGGDAARGQAPPGGFLSSRNPLFGARSTSGPADVWNLSDQTRWTLQQKYRDLANRELAARNFDRAAYIFAELLGDWFAAAGALISGRRFQEAARIYLTRFNNKELAAKCLEDGGLYAEAVVLFAELHQHEKCGDLFRKLEREREAVAAYQEAIKGSQDRLHDARILFEKLHQPGLALSVLQSGYPASSQARQCLQRHFEYLTRQQAESEALALAASLADPTRQLADPAAMTETLQTIHQFQKSGPLRDILTRVAFGVVGNALTKNAALDRRLLQLLPKFVPDDNLLRRDASRYHDIRDRQRRRAAAPAPSASQGLLILVRRATIPLPQDGSTWTRLISRGHRWLAIGHHEKTRQDVWVLGEEQKVIGKLTSASGWGSNLNLHPLFPTLPDVVWLPFVPPGELARYGQAKRSDFSFIPETRDLLIARLAWMPPGVVAVHSIAEGVWLLHRNVTQTIDLSFYAYDGKLIRTHALGWAPPGLDGPFHLVTHGSHVFVAAETHLLHVQEGQLVHHMEMPADIVEIVVSDRLQAAAVLAVTDQEVVLVAPGKELESIQIFSSARQGLSACFLADGRIAAGDDSSGVIYSAYPHARLQSSLVLDKECVQKARALAAHGARGVAVLRSDGFVECYE